MTHPLFSCDVVFPSRQLESNEDIDALAILHPYDTFLHDLVQYVRGLVKEHDSQSEQIQAQQGEVPSSSLCSHRADDAFI
jgi:hypothetical protein